MAKISVLTITARYLYLSDQAQALKDQTFQDFEWIVVDQNRVEHERELRAVVGKGFPLIHLCDEKKSYPATSAALNMGLIHASGEMVYFMSDYILPMPNVLKRHWEIYQKYPKVFVSGRSARVDCSPAALDLSIGNIDAKDYRKGINEKKIEIEDGLFEVVPTLSMTWWGGRNDSAPLDALLGCNGFEEALDGRWGGADGEMANRMVTYGLRYLHDMRSLCLEFQHESAKHGRPVRSAKEQLEMSKHLSESRHEAGIYKGNQGRDLMGEWYENFICDS